MAGKKNTPRSPRLRDLPVVGVRAATETLFRHVKDGKQRACGSCTACCTVLQVNDLKPAPKPGYCNCPHQRVTRDRRGRKPGCQVYADRPPTCQGYECYWLGGLFENRDRPDRIGMIVDSADGVLVGLSSLAGFPVIVVRECWDGAHNGKRFKLAMAGLITRTAILYHGEGYPYLMAPNAEMMGKLQAASAKLDHWSKLTDQHRVGEHDGGAVPECPVCDGACPVHTEENGGFFAACTVCQESLREALIRQASAGDSQ